MSSNITGSSKLSDDRSSLSSDMMTSGQGRGGINVSGYSLRTEQAETESKGFLEDSQAIYSTKPGHVDTKLGSSGTQVRLKANMFEIEEFKDFEFNQYRVDFYPDLDLSNIRKAFIGKNISPFGGYLYDGVSTLFTTAKLPQDQMSFDCQTREGMDYKLTVKFSNQKIDRFDNRALLIMNIMLRRAMEGLDLKLIQRNLFDPENIIDIKEFKLNLWPGYQTSIRQYENRILLNCDMRFKVMRQETVYDILRTCCAEDQKNGRDAFKAQILGCIVMANYGTKRTYRVSDVDFSVTPKSTFDWKGRTISYMDYFKEQYGIVIRDPNQPMILSTPKERDVRGQANNMQVCLVAELLLATGLTDTMRANFQLMRAMAEHTRMDPSKRVDQLLRFSNRLNNTKKSLDQFAQFHTKLKTELVEFNGREMAQENMVFGGEKTCLNEARNVDWTNPMKTSCMHTNVELKRWVVISPKRASVDTSKFMGLLNEVAAGMKYSMGSPKVVEIADDRVGTYAAELQRIIQMDPKFILIVLPNANADRYAAIKKITCVQSAIATQVVVQKTMMPKKGNMGGVKSIATKVLIQMNCKLGGAAWMVKIPIGGVMTVGFDVTHDTTDKRKSFGAFVAALDLKRKAKFFSSVSSHMMREECSNNITLHMRKALICYKEEYGLLPERIMFYRDGVGDGDIQFVNTYEVAKLNELFDEFYKPLGQTPKFCFIIVNKRINVRIFKPLHGGKLDNPPSGTVVDNTITQPERYDFYLISQSVRQGTVAPTSYNIVYDTFGLTPDKIQILTYKNCHLYYNWSGTTRVPAVVQYCQKLAILVGEHLHAVPQASLENQLYFL